MKSTEQILDENFIVLEPKVASICRAIESRGGRSIVVGGCVRDALLGVATKDIDIEVYNLNLDELESILGDFGFVLRVGRSFGVLRIKSLDIDFSLPRRDSKVGDGHRGFDVACDPGLSFEQAGLRRDLTINSIGFDPNSNMLLDPHNGRADIEAGILRATDAEHFSEDPLRGLRVAQFAARFEMTADDELIGLCEALDLSELSAERLHGEFEKLLLRGSKPSIALEFLRETKLLRFFPELMALIDVPQSSYYHPEGDVWIHTLLCLDAAVNLRVGQRDSDWPMMLAVLCHDLGKPSSTVEVEMPGEEGGAGQRRIRSHGHEAAGVEPTVEFLNRLRVSNTVLAQVSALVKHHLAPRLFISGGAKPKAYQRLARKLQAAGTTMEMLAKVSRADQLGRTTDDALAGLDADGDRFLELTKSLGINKIASPDVVMGRHLIERGYQSGKHFQELLLRCRDYQDSHAGLNADAILEAVLTPSQQSAELLKGG